MLSEGGNVLGFCRVNELPYMHGPCVKLVSGCRRLIFEETSMRPEFVVAMFQPIRAGQLLQLLEVFEQMSFQGLRGRGRVVMRAAERFGNDVIHQAKFVEVL